MKYGSFLIGAMAFIVMGMFAFAMPSVPLSAQFMTNTPDGAVAAAPQASATIAPPPAQPTVDMPVLAIATAVDVPVVAATIDPSLPPPPVIFNAPECRYVEGQPTSDACIALMEKYPEPNVTPIQPDGYTLSQYSFWKLRPGQDVTKYDAPGGNAVGTIPVGFNFINATDTSVEGWLEIQDGGWIQREFAESRSATYFTGVTLPPNWSKPFGWVLDTTGIYASLYPGGPYTKESGLIPMHYEIFSIYAEEVDSEGWKWYLVGPNQWVKQVYMAVIQPTDRPQATRERWVSVDLFEQTLVAYEGDTPVFATLISTGLPGTETNEGLFEVWAGVPNDHMSGATGAPDAYALQNVPWVMYFDGGISLHGTYWHDTFGYRRSHGCVNLSISDARWVYNFYKGATETTEKGEPLLQVLVHSTGDYREGDNK